MRYTKIICTIGPATQDVEMLRGLVAEGMDVARLNFSHGDHETHAANIRRIRAAATEVGRPVAILADLQGPKLRVGRMADEGVMLQGGTKVTLTTDPIVGHGPDALPVQYGGLPDLVEGGDRILLDDGLLELRVLSTGPTTIDCQVVTGGLLLSNKGLNLPHVTPDIPAVTDKDRGDLAFALAQQVDWIALSFVRNSRDVEQLKGLIAHTAGADAMMPVMAKIEKPAAVGNLEEIMQAADGVMVARGDLGIEMPPESVPLTQKRIIRACNQSGVPVVTATQMLDSMIRNPLPTRAEASDVANAILDGTDAVMLSGETSIGAYPIQAVQTMIRIIREVEASCAPAADHRAPRMEPEPLSIADAVTHAARDTAQGVGAAAIITPTVSGYTARLMSRHRPHIPIIAVTPSTAVQRRLALYWGIVPLAAPRTKNTDEMIDQAVRAACRRGLIRRGDTVVITAGSAGSAPGTTNLLRVHVVE